MCEPITSKDVSCEDRDQHLNAELLFGTFGEKTVIKESDILQANGDIQVTVKEKPIINDDNPYDFFTNSRQILPGRILNRRFNVWSYIKEFVGRDLTRITLPITMNEPLSLLHKYPECFGSPELMHKMINASNPVERIENMAAYFAVSQASHAYRTFKPFNPLLGETYEFRKDEENMLFITEQICHHPPITAFFSHMPNFKGYGSFHLGIKFTGNSIDTIIDGAFTYEFSDSNGSVEAVITVVPPICTARNIIIGKY